MPPQPGDHLIFLTGAKKGEQIRGDDLVLGGPQIQAYPASPEGVVRNGSRLNLVILVRVGLQGLSEGTAAEAADGVVAYSAICTHQGCPVNMWSTEQSAFVCSCHASTYNPRNGAEVISGPAPRSLPALPLKSDNGVLIVAAPFTGQVGARQV
jgi:Rieske Fe-S protein